MLPQLSGTSVDVGVVDDAMWLVYWHAVNMLERLSDALSGTLTHVGPFSNTFSLLHNGHK